MMCAMRRWSCGVAVAVSLAAVPSWAGRPLTTDDADPVDAGCVEAEAGVSRTPDGSSRSDELTAGLTFGLMDGLEAGVAFGGLRDKTEEGTASGWSDTTVGLKWRCASSGGFRCAIAPSVSLPTADEEKGLGSGEADVDATWIGSVAIGDAIGVHANAGYTWVGDPEGEDPGDVVHGGVAVDVMLCGCHQWVGEIQAEDERAAGADPLIAFNTGLRWFAGDLTLDLSAGAPIEGEGPDHTVTAGATYVFGGND